MDTLNHNIDYTEKLNILVKELEHLNELLSKKTKQNNNRVEKLKKTHDQALNHYQEIVKNLTNSV